MMDDEARRDLALGDDLLSAVLCLRCGFSNFAAHRFCRDCAGPSTSSSIHFISSRGSCTLAPLSRWLRPAIMAAWLLQPLVHRSVNASGLTETACSSRLALWPGLAGCCSTAWSRVRRRWRSNAGCFSFCCIRPLPAQLCRSSGT